MFSIFFFFENHAVYENAKKKYGGSRQALISLSYYITLPSTPRSFKWCLHLQISRSHLTCYLLTFIMRAFIDFIPSSYQRLVEYTLWSFRLCIFLKICCHFLSPLLLLLLFGIYNPCEFESPHSWGFMITHDDTPQSVGLLWTSDQPVSENFTWQHTQHLQ